MGTKGTVASTAALAVLLQEGIGDTIRVSLTPQPGEARTQEVVVALEILQSLGLRHFNPSVTACPGCGRTTSTTFQELTKQIDDFLRAQMPVWRDALSRASRGMKVAVMGCIVNGPGESKHADIGISLPGTGEAPSAPVFIDGEKRADAARRQHRRRVPGDRRAIHRTALRRSNGSALTLRAASPADSPHPAPRPLQRAARSALLMAEILRAVKGMNDIFPASVPRKASETLPTSNMWQWFEQTARSVLQRYGYQNLMHADRRADGAVRARHRRGDRHRREGDVLLRGLDERRQAHAAPRGHRRHRARDDRAQRALQRPAAAVVDGRRCSATSGRRRAATASSTSSTSRRSASPARTSTPSRSCCTRALLRELGLKEGEHVRLEINSLGQPAERAGAPRRADRVFRGPRRAARRGRAAPPAEQSAAHPGQQEPGDAGDDRRGAAS